VTKEMDCSDLLTIDQAAARMTERGYPVSVPTLRKWRPTWPNGDCRGPQPLLISKRRLRYRPEACDKFVDDALAAATRATAPPPEKD
jgi:hypothetical protein